MERSLQILLVDDGEIVHQTIADYLSDSGHRVDRVHDALAALEYIEARTYDMALVDLQMPGMDRFSFLAKMQEIRPEMSVVIMTGHGDMDVAIRALRVGAADFLTKPIKLLELDAILEKSIRTHGLVAQRTQMEEALQESERRYHLLAENVTDVVWMTDMNLRSTYVNPAVTRMLGCNPEEAMALTWEEILTPTSLEAIKKIIAEELSEENIAQRDLFRLWNIEIELTGRDGSTVWAETKCAFLRDPDGLPVGVLGILRDVTERRKTPQVNGDQLQDSVTTRGGQN
jgi:PAS domain S-box-containing protein